MSRSSYFMSLSLIFLALFLLLDDWMRSDDPPPLVIQASACAVQKPAPEAPPSALLPRDGWHGSRIVLSKDGGVA